MTKSRAHLLFFRQQVELVPQRQARLVHHAHLPEHGGHRVLLLLPGRGADVDDVHDNVGLHHLRKNDPVPCSEGK